MAAQSQIKEDTRMRFGMSGAFLPGNMDRFTEETAQRVRALGFSGIFARFLENGPDDTTEAQCRRVRSILEAHGLTLYQMKAYREPYIHFDEAIRAEAVRRLRAAIRQAAWLGAHMVEVGPGSFNPRGAWFPHPDNWNPRAQEQLIKSLREAAPAAEDAGVVLSLEGHQLVTLRSAEVMRDVVDAVDSPAVRCHFDPVNWITLETVYASGAAIDRWVDLLGRRIVSAHAKDVVVEDRLVVHLSERPAGQGLLDYRTFLRRMHGLDPNIPVIVEGATSEQLPAVKAFLDRTAAELGIEVT
jgi:sugar phosphate isomerase/epimerase